MEMTANWLGLEPQSKEIPHDSQIKLIDGLSEDPEDHPDGFIPIIERHNARLKKAHFLHKAIRDIIQQARPSKTSENSSNHGFQNPIETNLCRRE